MKDFDVIVVGAGAAGTSAALVAARGGLRTALLERGPYPGAKNLMGGVLYTNVLAEILPGFRAAGAPLERHVAKKGMSVLSARGEMATSFRTVAWDEAPHNHSYTVLRARFDRWYAAQAEAAGAELVSGVVVDRTLKDDAGRVVGVSVLAARVGELAPLAPPRKLISQVPDAAQAGRLARRVVGDDASSLLAKSLPQLANPLAERVLLGIQRHLGEAELDELADREPLLAHCAGAAVAGTAAAGPRHGKPALRLLDTSAVRPEVAPVLAAEVGGLRLYAERKKWGLGEIAVRLGHRRIHAEDCADCESESGQVAEIERTISLGGELDEKQRERLLEIADRCPVHRTLGSEIKIRSRLI